MTLGQCLRTTVIGLPIGLLFALAMTRLMSHFLYNVVTIDLLPFAFFTSLLASAALLAAHPCPSSCEGRSHDRAAARIMRTSAICLAVVCLGRLTDSFTLKDQFGTEKTIGAPSTEWTLIIYGDRVDSEYSSIWGKGLKAHGLPHCRIVFAANLRSVPFLLKE